MRGVAVKMKDTCIMCMYISVLTVNHRAYTHLLCGVAISPRVKAEEHNVLHKLQVGVESRCAVPSSQCWRDGDLCEGVKESEEGAGEGVLLRL